MTAIVIKSNLREALGAILAAAGENANLPILRNVLIETRDDALTLTATNLEIAVRYHCPAKIVEPGKVTVPLGLLSGVIANLPSERITFEASGNDLVVKTENYEGTLVGLPVDDFPIIPKPANEDESLTMPGALLTESLRQVTIAAQPSDLRPELASVHIAFSLDTLKFVATDSFRLAERTVPAKQLTSTYARTWNILVPLKTAYELTRILKDEDTVRLFHDEHQLFVSTDRASLTSRLLDGTFPDYQAIIPDSFTGEAILERNELLTALKLVGVTSGRNNEVKLKFMKKEKTIELSSIDQASGQNRYTLPAKLEGDGGELVFNWKSLSDGCKALGGDDLFFGVNNDKPALVRDAGDGSYFYILAPITV